MRTLVLRFVNDRSALARYGSAIVIALRTSRIASAAHLIAIIAVR